MNKKHRSLLRNLLIGVVGLNAIGLAYGATERPPINVDMVKQEIELHRELLHVADGKQIVAFFGQTNSGKSTLINYLAGKPLTVNRFDDIVLVHPEDTSAMPIGINAASQTQYPKAIRVGDTLLVDFPGFGDTRGLEKDLVNAAYTQHILKSAASIKIVFVCSQDEVTAGKGAYFKSLIDTAYGLFPSKNVVEESSLFVLTKSNQPSLEKTKEWIKTKCAPCYLAQLDGWLTSGRFFATKKPIAHQISQAERPPVFEAIRSCRGNPGKDINISAVYSQTNAIALNHLLFKLMSEHIQTKMALKDECLAKVDLHLRFLNAANFMQTIQTSLSKTATTELLQPLCTQQYESTWQEFEKACVPYLKDWVAYFETKKNSLIEAEKKTLDTHMSQCCVQFIEAKKQELSLNDRYTGRYDAQSLLHRLQRFDRAQLQAEFSTILQNDALLGEKRANSSTATISSSCETDFLRNELAKALDRLTSQVSQKIDSLKASIAKEIRSEELRRQEEVRREAEYRRQEEAERRRQAEREQRESEERERTRQIRLQQEIREAEQERKRQREREAEAQRQRDEADADRIALRLANGQEEWQQREAQAYHNHMQGLLRSGTTFSPTLGVPLMSGANFGVAAYPARMGGNIVWFGI